jgi:hypothetical protein
LKKPLSFELDALKESLKQLETKIPVFLGFIAGTLVRRCHETLIAVRAIPGQYRMTNKDAPTKASAFVSAILTPYSSYMTANSTILGPKMESDVRDHLVPALLFRFDSFFCSSCKERKQNFCDPRYNNLVTELLNTIKKAEDSLMRLKTKRKGIKATSESSSQISTNAEAKASLSDEDKIRLQLLLDVEGFGVELQAIGVDLPQLEPYQILLEVVRQAEKVQV